MRNAAESDILRVLSGPVNVMGIFQLRTCLAHLSPSQIDHSLALLAEEGLIWGAGGAWQLTLEGAGAAC